MCNFQRYHCALNYSFAFCFLSFFVQLCISIPSCLLHFLCSGVDLSWN